MKTQLFLLFLSLATLAGDAMAEKKTYAGQPGGWIFSPGLSMYSPVPGLETGPHIEGCRVVWATRKAKKLALTAEAKRKAFVAAYDANGHDVQRRGRQFLTALTSLVGSPYRTDCCAGIASATPTKSGRALRFRRSCIKPPRKPATLDRER